MPARYSNPRPSACKADAQTIMPRPRRYTAVKLIYLRITLGNITSTTIHLTRTLEQEMNYFILNHVPSIWVQLSRKWEHASCTRTYGVSKNALYPKMQNFKNFYYIKDNWIRYFVLFNPKRAGGGRNPPPRHFLLYLSRFLFFRAETSWLFFFKPCAWF